MYKIAPTVLIAGLNVRIMMVYRQTCDKRRRMTLSHTKDDDSRKFAEERRLMLLLGMEQTKQEIKLQKKKYYIKNIISRFSDIDKIN